MNKIKWIIKQLFPLTYWSNYKEEDKEIITIWKMFLGKVYHQRSWEVKNG